MTRLIAAEYAKGSHKDEQKIWQLQRANERAGNQLRAMRDSYAEK